VLKHCPKRSGWLLPEWPDMCHTTESVWAMLYQSVPSCERLLLYLPGWTSGYKQVRSLLMTLLCCVKNTCISSCVSSMCASLGYLSVAIPYQQWVGMSPHHAPPRRPWERSVFGTVMTVRNCRVNHRRAVEHLQDLLEDQSESDSEVVMETRTATRRTVLLDQAT
jgi:hypothetical protein